MRASSYPSAYNDTPCLDHCTNKLQELWWAVILPVSSKKLVISHSTPVSWPLYNQITRALIGRSSSSIFKETSDTHPISAFWPLHNQIAMTTVTPYLPPFAFWPTYSPISIILIAPSSSNAVLDTNGNPPHPCVFDHGTSKFQQLW